MNAKQTAKKHNVKIVDTQRFLVECNQCGQTWSPILQEGGRLPRGWWKCPYGCNTTQEG
jgi:hypothetical protein